MRLQFKEQDFRLQAVQRTHDIRQSMQTLAVRGTSLNTTSATSFTGAALNYPMLNVCSFYCTVM